MTENQLRERIKADAIYREMLAECEKLEEDFLRIKSQLPDEEQRLLEKYISLREELEYRRTVLAMQP